jgi:hypothetical protein
LDNHTIMLHQLNENKDLLIVAIASFFIGFGAASFFGGPPADVPEQEQSALRSDTLPPLSFETEGEGGEEKSIGGVEMERESTAAERVEMLRVENQRAGSFMQIQHAELADARWIAVREINEDGTPGNILGAGWQPAGVHNDIEVKLLRETTGGEHYQALLYEDTGNDKRFDHTIDRPLDVSASFSTVASPGGF